MAYKFPKPKDYSIKRAQKRLELTDDELEECLENRWLRPALPKAVIYGAEHLAVLPADQAGHLPAEPEEQADMLHPLPDYAYSVVEDGPRGHVVFEDLSGDTFFLVVVRRYSTTHSNDEEITAPGFYRQGKPDPNAEISVRVDPVKAWDLAQAICGEEYGFDPEEIIGGHLVVPEEEIERFIQKYGVVNATRSKSFQAPITPEEAYLSRKAEGTDPYLQAWAEHLAQALMVGGLSAPTKLEIAEELLAHARVVVKSVRAPTLKPSAVAGLIRNTWDPKLTK